MKEKNILKNILMVTLTVCMFLTFSGRVQAESVDGQTVLTQKEELQLLTNEEYDTLMRQESEGISNTIESLAEDQENLRNTDEKMPIINDDVNNSLALEGISELSGEDGIVAHTAPQSTIKPYILNTDSLKDGKITTDTQIAWLNDFSDEDGDTLQDYSIGGFPFRYLVGGVAYSDGFITQFTDPGNYKVLYRAIDSAGELSDITGYNVEVVSVEDYQVMEGSLSSETDKITYTVDVDFSKTDAATFALVKKGLTNVRMIIKDAAGNEINRLGTDSKRWCFIERPSTDSGVCAYTIDVEGIKDGFVSGSADFRVIVGDKKDTEAMISGPENAVLLEKYTQQKSNFILTRYTPNKDQSWYRFTADSATVFTIMTEHPELRFQICDVNSLLPLFDSNDPENADIHKNKFVSAFPYVEKAKLAMTAGKEYYLVLYANSQISPLDIVEDTINLAVGLPHMASNSTEWFYSSNQITATTSSFSNSGYISVGDGGDTIPMTAVAETVYYGGTSSGGIRPSAVEYFRVKDPRTGIWRNSDRFGYFIYMDYTADSNSNININGTWQLSFKSSTKTVSFTPAMRILYRYEIGD